MTTNSLEYMREWRENNRPKVHAYNKTWRHKHPEQMRAYRNEYLRKWRAKNRDKLREYDKKYRLNHPEVTKAYWQKYKQRYYELRKTRKEQQRLQREHFKLQVFQHYTENGNIECSCCGEKILGFLTLDHSNNDGGGGKRKTGTGSAFYYWLRRNNYPQNLVLKILFYNCNFGLRHDVFPHKNILNKGDEAKVNIENLATLDSELDKILEI